MATFSTQASNAPFTQVSLITDVAVGDQIDFVEVFGRPAKAVAFTTTDPTDNVTYRLNNKVVRRQVDPVDQGYAPMASGVGGGPNEVSWWSTAGPLFDNTGENFTTVSGLAIYSLEIDGLTLSTGTTITLVAL